MTGPIGFRPAITWPRTSRCTNCSLLSERERFESAILLCSRCSKRQSHRQLVSSLPVLIGCDEFPVGYSLAGCPPAEPASASPTGTILNNPRCRTMIFQQTATAPLTSCLSPRVHSILPSVYTPPIRLTLLGEALNPRTSARCTARSHPRCMAE